MKRCTFHGRRLCWWCIAQSLAFPVEHVVWERLPGLAYITTHILGV